MPLAHETPAKYAVVITAQESRAQTTVPVLEESLRLAGVPEDAVHVVTSPRPDPLAGLWQAAKWDAAATPWIVHLQDTMIVGREFKARLEQIIEMVAAEGAAEGAGSAAGPSSDPDPAVDCVRLSDRDSLGVGLYRATWLAHVPKIPGASADAVFDACARHRAKFLGKAADDREAMGEFRYDDAEDSRSIVWFPALDVYALL